MIPKKVLLTGAGSGFGKQAAIALARRRAYGLCCRSLSFTNIRIGTNSTTRKLTSICFLM